MREEEEYVEIDSSLAEEKKLVHVRVEKLESFADAERILNFLRNGEVIFVKISELKNKNLQELKKAVEKLKKTCVAIEGDLAGVDEDYLLLTPSFARIHRGK